MSDSLNQLSSSSSNVKADPFALADLDRLADEMLEVVKSEAIASPSLEKLIGQMKVAVAQVTEFFIAQV